VRPRISFTRRLGLVTRATMITLRLTLAKPQ
jgi:hypothetical protein